MAYISRTGWGSTWFECSTLLDWPQVEGFAIHHSAAPAPSEHENCPGAVRAIERTHKNSPEGYCAIAYNTIVCPHGDIYEGRGWGFVSGSQGNSAANRAYFSACVLGDAPEPTAAVTRALRWLRGQILTRNPVATRVRPHSDFTATACPGGALRQWIADKGYEEDDMAFTDKQEAALKVLADAMSNNSVNGSALVKAVKAAVAHIADHPKYVVTVEIKEPD